MSRAAAPGARILVVDDEPALRRAVERNLAGHGFDVRGAETGEAGLELETRFHPDLVLLDMVLPDISGTDVIEQLRQRSSVPIIVLSVRGAEGDKVRALELGADDYLTKPFGVDELLARIRVALRHAAPSGSPQDSVFRSGDLAVDLERREVTVAGRQVHLTPTEYALLGALIAHAGRVLTVRLGGPLPARLYGASAEEAGARPGQSAAPAHGGRRRLSPAGAGGGCRRTLSRC
jgi:two-component system KDP operon response regulator KdpE